jgi:hypothetical protein
MAIALEKQDARQSNGRLANQRIFVKCSAGTPADQNPFNFNVFPPTTYGQRRGNEARRRRKGFAVRLFDFAVGVNDFAPIRLGFQGKLRGDQEKRQTSVMFPWR